uniref:ABC transporter domain-containing protein n=1 Tax=Steinernema glaseri TaxID=37863 RepID=A0A1I7Y1B9_9BILA
MKPRRGGDLSGGQQQQLAIGRALASRPRLLILDEPTEGIQPSVIKEIGAVIRQLAARGDMAILLVEQFYDFAAELADQYLVMSRGEIVQQGRGENMEAEGALIERARGCGKHVMVAAIESGNTASIRLHERLGFTLNGQMPQ